MWKFKFHELITFFNVANSVWYRFVQRCQEKAAIYDTDKPVLKQLIQTAETTYEVTFLPDWKQPDVPFMERNVTVIDTADDLDYDPTVEYVPEPEPPRTRTPRRMAQFIFTTKTKIKARNLESALKKLDKCAHLSRNHREGKMVVDVDYLTDNGLHTMGESSTENIDVKKK